MAKQNRKHNAKTDVSKSFFAVVHQDYMIDELQMLLLGRTRKQAISIWEHWNPNTTFKKSEIYGWKIKRYTAKNVC